MWTAWTTPERQDWCRGAHVCCPPCSTARRALLLPADGALQTFHGRLERAVLLDAPLGDGGGMHDRRVIAAAELADVREGRVPQAGGGVHAYLPRYRAVPAAAVAGRVGWAQRG